MLTKIIVSSFAVLIEICIWIVLVAALIGGWQFQGFFGAEGALIFAFVLCVIIFGAFGILLDIRNTVREIQKNCV